MTLPINFFMVSSLMLLNKHVLIAFILLKMFFISLYINTNFCSDTMSWSVF